MNALLAQSRFTPAALASQLGVTADTLAGWRRDGTGPAFIKISDRKVVYAESDVEHWLQSARKKGDQGHGNQEQRRLVALPIDGARKEILREHRFGGLRRKSEGR